MASEKSKDQAKDAVEAVPATTPPVTSDHAAEVESDFRVESEKQVRDPNDPRPIVPGEQGQPN